MIYIIWTGWVYESGHPESFYFKTIKEAETYLKNKGYKKERQDTGEVLNIIFEPFGNRYRWARICYYTEGEE